MGLADGMVPSPSALVVLLGAIALGRIPFGIALVCAYGIGLAATLVDAGLLLVRFEGRARRWSTTHTSSLAANFAIAISALPLLSGFAIAGAELLLVLRSLQALQLPARRVGVTVPGWHHWPVAVRTTWRCGANLCGCRTRNWFRTLHRAQHRHDEHGPTRPSRRQPGPGAHPKEGTQISGATLRTMRTRRAVVWLHRADARERIRRERIRRCATSTGPSRKRSRASGLPIRIPVRPVRCRGRSSVDGNVRAGFAGLCHPRWSGRSERADTVPLRVRHRHDAQAVGLLEEMKVSEGDGMFT